MLIWKTRFERSRSWLTWLAVRIWCIISSDADENKVWRHSMMMRWIGFALALEEDNQLAWLDWMGLQVKWDVTLCVSESLKKGEKFENWRLNHSDVTYCEFPYRWNSKNLNILQKFMYFNLKGETNIWYKLITCKAIYFKPLFIIILMIMAYCIFTHQPLLLSTAFLSSCLSMTVFLALPLICDLIGQDAKKKRPKSTSGLLDGIRCAPYVGG